MNKASQVSVESLPRSSDFEPADMLSFWDRDNPHALLWDFNLPSNVDSERIVVNGKALRRLQRVGAVSCSIIREYQGEVSTFTPGINGMQADGTALATKAGHAEKKPLGEAKTAIDPSISKLIHGTNGRAVLIQSFNKPELASQVSDRVHTGSKTREQAWTERLNTAFEMTFRSGAREMLINQENKPLRYLGYYLYSNIPILGIESFVNQEVNYYPAMLSGVYGIEFLRQALKARTVNESVTQNRRWSAFPYDYQPDRYLAVNALSRLYPVFSCQK